MLVDSAGPGLPSRPSEYHLAWLQAQVLGVSPARHGRAEEKGGGWALHPRWLLDPLTGLQMAAPQVLLELEGGLCGCGPVAGPRLSGCRGRSRGLTTF